MALMLAFAFGCFKLTRRELLGLTLLTVLAYLATIPLIKKVDGVHFNLAVELTLWITFSVFMPSLALVASTFSGLRQRLSETNQKLTYLNRYDSLTGVNNRAYFNEKYDLEWRRSQRSRGMIALLVIDIDHFKCVNDTFGHLAGDACLKHVAKIIVEAARRPTDDAFRYGGEEFMVLLANTDAQGAAHIGEIIRSKIEASEIVFDGKQISLTISAGVSAAIPEPGSTCDILIACADRAMYQAKENGRNRVSVYGQEVHRIP
jgi:diguanylate cyclase (GGDEF)-like protein